MLPTRLVIENFFSHKNTEIDFSEFSSALLIGNTEGDYGKSNGAGKSAIFEAVVWALFNKSRVAMMDDVIKWGELSCKVILEFLHDGKNYKVTRTRFSANSTTNIELKTLDSFGTWKDISGSTSGETNQRIENVLKLDYRTFINSTYFRQNDISEFAESEASKKKDILKSIIDLSRWDEYEKASKSKTKELNAEVKLLQLSIQEYDSTVQSLEQVKKDLETNTADIESLTNKKKLLEEKIYSAKSSYEKLKQSLDTAAYDRLNADISNIMKEGKTVKADLASATSQRDSSEKELNSLRDELEKVLSGLGSKPEDVDDSALPELSAQLTYHKSKFISLQKELESLDKDKANLNAGICPTCSQEISEEKHNHLVSSREESRSSLKKEIQNSKIEADSLNSQIDSINKKLEKTKKLEKANYNLNVKKDVISYKIEHLEKELAKSSEAASKLQEKFSALKTTLQDKQKLLESIRNDDFQILRKDIISDEESLSKISQSISDKDKALGRLQERESVLSEKIEKLKENKELLDYKLQKISVFDRLTKLLSKTGIQTLLLDNVIQDLEKTSNNILNHICNEPASIVLETQRVGSDGVSIVETLDLKVRKDGSIYNFKSLSGGEQFRISLSLRIAMSEISSKYGGSSLEFLLLDEVNSPLDRYGVETLFMSVIKSLEDRYKILIITHDEALKEKFDNIINITKINGDSEVTFVSR